MAGAFASQTRAGASGSVLLSQILGAAEVMGYKDVPIPDLPVERIAAVNPLRAAIVGWIAATGSIVPPDELARELLRADALPIDVQRDVALLLLAATDATLLQRAALAQLTPGELEWIFSHPEVGEELAAGVDTPQTRTMALLAAKVDMEKSIAASLLLLQAIEATRGSLSQQGAGDALELVGTREIDATTRAILDLLASARADASDKDKVIFAAQLVALSSGFTLSPPGPAPSFADALQSLMSASNQAPDAAALAAVTERANVLPADLQGAIARLIEAEARAIRAADPAHMTPTSQQQALAGMLVATAEALPVLEKYGFYWTATPDALRMGEWEPAARLGWVAHHAALFVTARDDIATLASVAPLMSGHGVAAAAVPERSFIEAYLAVANEAGFRVTDEMRTQLEGGVAQLDPAVRDAATVLLSGAAESARLQRLAYAGVSPEEQRFLRFEADGLDALYSASLSDADLARLERAVGISQRVDADQLAAAGVVATLAASEARRILEGADAFSTQSAVTHVGTGLRGLLARFLPVGGAQAQAEQLVCSFNGLFEICPPGSESDIIFRLVYPSDATQGFTPGEYVAYQLMSSNTGLQVDDGNGVSFCVPGVCQSVGPDGSFGGSGQQASYAATCDTKECVVYQPSPDPGNPPFFSPTLTPTPGEATHDLLVITGVESRTYRPERAARVVCPAVVNPFSGLRPSTMGCRDEVAFRYGAATIRVDLGGDDDYALPVAMVHANSSLPLSIHLDIQGNDKYRDPTVLYDGLSPVLRDLGANAGHPTQASAVYGGVAVLVDAAGEDKYSARTRSQGFGRLGLALLADLGGAEEIYSGGEWTQGASSETFTLGGGILIDQGGDDDYTTETGQGFGLGGVFLDIAGFDTYRNGNPALGLPVVHLDIIPGGDVTTLDERDDNRVWVDGPGTINFGIGIDQEAVLTTADDDLDGYPDVVEFVAGTDVEDPNDNPQSNPTARASLVVVDSDGDGYYDYIENALSTDPDNGASYPAGFPRGVAVRVPGEVWGQVYNLPLGAGQLLGNSDGRIAPFENENATAATGSNFTGSDKIVDLRLPLQNAGSIDYPCTGQWYLNSTLPMGILPGVNVLNFVNGSASEDPTSGGARRLDDGSVFERCVFASYSSSSPGNGNGTLPKTSNGAQNAQSGDEFSYQIPAGILAIGDVVDTDYTEDYFVVIDLGGSDWHPKGAGGALVVKTQPRGPTAADPESDPYRRASNSFIAPSLAVSIDIGNPQNTGVVEAGAANDRYVNATRDFTHGSYFGVLVDTGGSDVYTANDGSQGALGGVLLDLDGAFDRYTARHLSQGASLAATPAGAAASPGETPTHPVADLPNGGEIPADAQGTTEGLNEMRVHRRILPGILLDFSATASKNGFVAGSHSQGFARGYPSTTPSENNAPAAYGILASIGESSDVYTTNGRYAQGVGGVDGVGILLDRAGSDTYNAQSFISQGATISQLVGTQDAQRNTAPHPATGILVDLAGDDKYVLKNTTLRATRDDNNFHVERSETGTNAGTSTGRVYADLGVFLDTITDPTAVADDPLAPIDGIAGAGSSPSIDATVGEGFHVYMPSARIAIGKDTPTVYEKEFAFVVDLGGKNTYKHNTGGLIRDILVEKSSTASMTDGVPITWYDGRFNLYPVSFVVDAGLNNSIYESGASFSQGSGFFGVGVVADLGGRDTFRLREIEGEPGIASAWIVGDGPKPVIDGTIGEDWENVPPRPIKLAALDDTRFTEDWTLRVANDGESIYLGLAGRTQSGDQERLRDELIIDLDMGRRYTPWDLRANRTGVDQVLIRYDNSTKACVGFDRGWNATVGTGANGQPPVGFMADPVIGAGGLDVDCRFTEDGQVFYEIKKKLLVDFPYDFQDLAYVYDETVGFGYDTNRTGVPPEFPASELGLFVRFMDNGAGYYNGACSSACPEPLAYTWPIGAVDADGAYGYPVSATNHSAIAEEMRDWGAVGLAQVGKNGKVPTTGRLPTLTQGAGLAGVGIVALLGTGLGESRLVAGDQSQGFGAYGGLGVLIDSTGSDSYESGKGTLGAAVGRGFGLFLDMEGNDVYASKGDSLGWSPALANGNPAASAAFLDLGGDDLYVTRPTNATQEVRNFRGALAEQGAAPQPARAGNNIVWVQNGSMGADYKILDSLRNALSEALVQSLYREQVRTLLNVTIYDPNNPGVWGNGCTLSEVPTFGGAHGGPDHPDFRVAGKVCLVATVNTSNGGVNQGVNDRLAPVRPTTATTPVEQAILALNNVTNSSATHEKIDVLSVDFLLDRARVATSYHYRHLNQTVSQWSAVVDLSEVQDGAVRAKALPLFAVNLTENRGLYLFSDAVNNDMTETVHSTAKRVLLVDNPSKPRLDLQPAYTGAANATFSPYAVGAQQKLAVNFTVNHDVGEDNYLAYNGFRPSLQNSSIPCTGVPAKDAQDVGLCNLLPFYFGDDGDEFTTTPGDAAALTVVGGGTFVGANMYRESIGDNPYEGTIPVLRHPLAIHLEDSFHVAIPSRTAIMPHIPPHTYIALSLMAPDGTEVLGAGGATDVWALGFADEDVKAPVPEVGIPPAVYDALDDATGQASTVVGLLNTPNLLSGVVDTAYNTTCVGNNASATWTSAQCAQLTGRWGNPGTAFDLCAPNPPRNNIPGQLLYIGWNSVNNFTTRGDLEAHYGYRSGSTVVPETTIVNQHVLDDPPGPSTCRHLFDDLNSTAAQYGNGTGVGGLAFSTVNSTLGTVNEALQNGSVGNLGGGSGGAGGVGFNEFFFEVNRTLPSANHCKGGPNNNECIRFEGSSIVIPAGYRIGLKMFMRTASDCLAEICDVYDSAFEGLANTLVQTVADNNNGPVDLRDPANLGSCGPAPCFDPVGSVAKQLRDNNPTFLQNTGQLSFLPASFFYFKSGEPNQQPRLEVRVPAQPSTNVVVTIDDAITGETARTLREGGVVVGDVVGTPTRDGAQFTWAGTEAPDQVNWSTTRTALRWTQNTIVYRDEDLKDGPYDVTVHATDATGTTKRSDRLLVDSTPSQTFIKTDLYTGRSSLRSGAIPIVWDIAEFGSGVQNITLYTRNGVEGDISDITTWKGPTTFPAGTRQTLHQKDASQTVYLFLAITTDRAGNVEAVKSTAEEPIQSWKTAIELAFAQKVKTGNYRRVLLDQGEPLFSSVNITGGKLVNYEGSEFAFVRAGAPIAFSVCARDLEDQVNWTRLNLDHIDPITGQLTSVSFNATKGEACENGGNVWTADQWPTVNENSTRFPQGAWSASFDVFDRAGNRLGIAAGNVILDHASPSVKLEAPVLPAGQSAVKPGDLVKIRLTAFDDFGVDDAGIRVDASAFAKNASALKTRPVRVNGVVFQEAQFTVDLPNLQNGLFNVTVKVPDYAANFTVVNTQIAVNFRPFEFVNGTLRVSNVTHNSVTLHWRTNEPTSALAKFGTSAVTLTGRTPQDLNATIDHALKIEGLAPSTHYFLRAVAVSAGGFIKESEVVEIDTTSALFLSPLTPVSGDKVSGMVRVKFRGGLLDSTDFVSYTLEVRDSAAKPWTFVTTATRQGDQHELTWNSTRFLDGKAYELRLTAKAGRDERVLVLDRLTSDNTPPSVLVLAPLLATNDTTPLLTAEATDALSGTVNGPARLLIDGVEVSKNVTAEPISGGRLRYNFEFAAPLAAGMRDFELQVQDLAGNLAREQWKVAIDGDAPIVKVNPTRYSPGTEAAKRGGTVTLNLTLEDLSGVAHVVADMSALNPAANQTRLVKIVNTDQYQATITVTASDAIATKVVSVRAVDLAGNTRIVDVDVPLDNVAPRVEATSIKGIGYREATIDVPADEPILVNGTATGPASVVTAATTRAERIATLKFDGLLPSRTYQFKITALDRAGNAVDLAGSFKTLEDTEKPSATGPLSVLDLLNGTLRLSWAPATDNVLVSHYRVYRSDDGITFRVLAETEATVFEDWGLPYEKSYVYKVAAVDFGANEGDASPALKAAATAIPHLTIGAVTPTVGTTSTTFRYSVTYLSPGGIAPAYVRVILDGVPQNMTLESGDAKSGAVYVYETRLAPHKRDAPHTYAFETSDGRYTVRFPDDGSVVRGPLVSGDILGSEDAGGFAAFAQRVPLGGVAGVAIALFVALGAAGLVRRRGSK